MLLLFFIFFFLHLPPTTPQNTFTPCNTTTPTICAPQTCQATPTIPCTPTSPRCLCLPKNLTYTPCTPKTCPSPSLCATSYFFTQTPICVSKTTLLTTPWLAPYSPTPIPSPPSPTGHTLSPCTPTHPCLTPRTCLSVQNFPLSHLQPCTTPPCLCIRKILDVCLLPSDCPVGESCYVTPFLPHPKCVSPSAATHPTFFHLSTPNLPAANRTTLTPCLSTSNCAKSLVCITYGRARTDVACTHPPCYCAPRGGPRQCAEGCDGDDVCAWTFLTKDRPLCIGRAAARRLRKVVRIVDLRKAEFSPLPSPTKQASVSPGGGRVVSRAVCVDVGLLRGLDRRELVFGKDVWARVLCDREGSCATEGHLVVWRGVGMIMSRYCRQVGCVGREGWVNSPRWRVGRRVGSRTEGLQFTAFAARWGTRVEERVLAGLVRAGL